MPTREQLSQSMESQMQFPETRREDDPMHRPPKPPEHKMISYVLGFCFNENCDAVALILKNKPDWQKGFYNGIGGKVEPGERGEEAMIREFKEETGLLNEKWLHYCTMEGPDGRDPDMWIVYVFHSVVSDADFYRIRSAEAGKVMCWPLRSLPNLNMISHLTWLIPLALDAIRTKGMDYRVVVPVLK